MTKRLSEADMAHMPDHWATVIAAANAEQARESFGAVADPFKVVAVSPRDVTHLCPMHADTERERGSKLYDWGLVRAGDWDSVWRGAPNPRVEENSTYRAVHERYIDGKSWEETGIFEVKMHTIARGGRVGDGCKSKEDLIERYSRLDRIFEDLRANGFRLSQDVERGSFDNLFVSIGRDGKLLVAKGGNHRLAMASILGLERVPAYVMTRHEEWQRIREQCAVAADPQDIPPHPDLAEFSESSP